MTAEFTGAKVAILWRGQVLTLLRDDRPDIPWPNRWDLPGGGREGRETPVECLRRETFEETGLHLPRAALRDLTRHGTAWFAVAELDLDRNVFRLGAEGQALRLMPVRDYLNRADAIPMFQSRLRGYLRGKGATSDPGKPARHGTPVRNERRES